MDDLTTKVAFLRKGYSHDDCPRCTLFKYQPITINVDGNDPAKVAEKIRQILRRKKYRGAESFCICPCFGLMQAGIKPTMFLDTIDETDKTSLKKLEAWMCESIDELVPGPIHNQPQEVEVLLVSKEARCPLLTSVCEVIDETKERFKDRAFLEISPLVLPPDARCNTKGGIEYLNDNARKAFCAIFILKPSDDLAHMKNAIDWVKENIGETKVFVIKPRDSIATFAIKSALAIDESQIFDYDGESVESCSCVKSCSCELLNSVMSETLSRVYRKAVRDFKRENKHKREYEAVGNPVTPSNETPPNVAPSIFISYAWEDESHKEKVEGLVETLRQKGYQADLDTTLLLEYPDFDEMMTVGLQKDKIIIVLSKKYKEKADNRTGGVWKEFKMIADDLEKNKNKYIFVIFDAFTESTKDEISPVRIGNRQILDLKIGKQNNYNELISRITGEATKGFSAPNPNIQVVEKEKVKPLEAIVT
jgi:hypothetical protein